MLGIRFRMVVSNNLFLKTEIQIFLFLTIRNPGNGTEPQRLISLIMVMRDFNFFLREAPHANGVMGHEK